MDDDETALEVAELHLSVQERIHLAISRLPVLAKDDIPLDDSCPICINPFEAALEGKAHEGLGEAPSESDELAGVTKLVGCGHIFCRACLVEWIRGRHGTCPSCRNVFSSIKPPSDSDVESSDGDYVPGDDEDEEDDDVFFDTDSEAFMETDSAFDDIDVEEDLDPDADMEEDADLEDWEAQAGNASAENWGLSDGDGSDSLSEVEAMAMSAELPPQDDGAGVYSDSGEHPGVLHAPRDESTEPK
ncbi:hypothetical protein K466DRAFT_602477 [Polyporus arcularius HHB13444]|uniref:RING-type domain-containing protein n=1 Tax=Polyporus arcularius HHB13444 TaxID=1314778 RepID=A0A5C3P4F2_9APHY|nr:hypothetical protein K466DRAFT_602477 [Polyporus arcularius HHB13444]